MSNTTSAHLTGETSGNWNEFESFRRSISPRFIGAVASRMLGKWPQAGLAATVDRNIFCPLGVNFSHE